MKAEYPPSPGTSVIITDGTKNTTCYAFDKGEHGWCQVYSILAKSIFGEEKFRCLANSVQPFGQFFLF